MASSMARIKQRAEAVQRLTNAANAAADALGVERAEIPTSHKDADYLPTVQIDAVAALLERIAGASEPKKPAAKAAAKKDASA